MVCVMSGGVDGRPVRMATLVALMTLAFGSSGWAQIDNFGLLTTINDSPGKATLFSTATNTLVGSPVTTAAFPQNATFSPDGRFAYTPNVSNSVSVIDVVSRTVVATIPVAGAPDSIVASRDGQFVYTTNS